MGKGWRRQFLYILSYKDFKILLEVLTAYLDILDNEETGSDQMLL